MWRAFQIFTFVVAMIFAQQAIGRVRRAEEIAYFSKDLLRMAMKDGQVPKGLESAALMVLQMEVPKSATTTWMIAGAVALFLISYGASARAYAAKRIREGTSAVAGR